MKKAISRTRKIEEALKARQPEEQMGLADRIKQAREKMEAEIKAGTYVDNRPEDPLERGRDMRKRLKKAGILK